MSIADRMSIHPQFIMDHLAKMRTKNGEPLLCYIINLRVIHIDLLDTLLSIGLPMYEAISEGNEVNYFDPAEQVYQVMTPLDLTFIRHDS